MAPDLSAHYDAGIPQEWGPGPWDPDFYQHWWARAWRSGDLRAWSPGDPLNAARQPITVRHGNRRRSTDRG